MTVAIPTPRSSTTSDSCTWQLYEKRVLFEKLHLGQTELEHVHIKAKTERVAPEKVELDVDDV
jgi:hypothetical protein